jgi:hypothetical protein
VDRQLDLLQGTLDVLILKAISLGPLHGYGVVLLKPLPYPYPDQLVTLHESKPNFPTGSISHPNFRDWQKNNHTFAAMAIMRDYSFDLTGRGAAERTRAEFISSNFFDILGVKPLLGCNFASGEDEIGASAPIALASEGF